MTDDRRLRRSFETELPAFRNSMIIGSDGVLYLIEQARRRGWGTVLWGYHPMFNKRLVCIELVISSTEAIPLDRAKTLLTEHVSTGKTKWTTRIFESRENLRTLIEGAATWEELFKVLLFDTKS